MGVIIGQRLQSGSHRMASPSLWSFLRLALKRNTLGDQMLRKLFGVSVLSLSILCLAGISTALASTGGCKTNTDCTSSQYPSCNTSSGKCECASGTCGTNYKCEAGVCKSADGSCKDSSNCSGKTPSCVNGKCQCTSTSCGTSEKCVEGVCKLDGECVKGKIKGFFKKKVIDPITGKITTSCATELACILPEEAC